ncbi:dTMP kinase [Herbiconiux sp. P18]|uniref:dTMP kinase n=1 Tax=Herbiconiux liangxiaofengii TaxID=3342795 RepID=UPI0035B96BC2
MKNSQVTLSQGSTVVFEGLDRTGKSTQLQMLAGALDGSQTVFAHMPSGFTPFTNRVYQALEATDEGPSSGLAQQLTHLACHAENIGALIHAAESTSLVLDRWWWSTLAYGWYGGSIEQSGLSESSFRELIRTIWNPIVPSLVFVFLKPYQLDKNNAEGVELGYQELVAAHDGVAVPVPALGPDETHAFIMDELLRRGIAAAV